jgi:hypothetical protein
MKNNYTIILFKNKVRYKILRTYSNFKKAETFYNKKIEENKNVFFEKQIINTKKINFEIALVEKNSKKIQTLFKTDSLGRNIPIKSDEENLKIIKIDEFLIEEKIFFINDKNKIKTSLFIQTFLKGNNLKMLSKLNNKIVLQEDENVKLFSLKTNDDANRFLDSLRIKLKEMNIMNCIIVKDTDTSQKKFLYNFLEEKGYDKKMLYRKSTTHLKGI